MDTGGVRIREARAEEAPAMLALWRRFWPAQPYEVNLPRKIETDPDLVLVAEADGQVCGTVIGGFDGWWAWVYRVAVAPEHQRRRIATQLVREMQERLRARGSTNACMVVDPSNEAMAGLLRGLGYGCNERHCVFGVRFGKEGDG